MKNLIQDKRLAKGISQGDFADMIGVSRFHLSRLENFKRTPSLPLLLKICEVLDCNLDEITLTEKK